LLPLQQVALGIRPRQRTCRGSCLHLIGEALIVIPAANPIHRRTRMLGKKDKQAAEAPASVLEIIDLAVTLKYIGDFLLQSQCSGHEAALHDKAIKLVYGQFTQVNKDVESHPEYPKYLAEQRAKKEAAMGKPEKADA
jgi:hypothetical protein